MTTKNKIARRKLSLLDPANDLSNVSRACKVMGYSRQLFYEIRRNFQTYGAECLIDRLPGAKGSHPNFVPAEIEAAVLAHALDHPCHGALRGEQELRLKGLTLPCLQLSPEGNEPLRERYLGQAASAVYLVRPDQHTAARWESFDASEVSIALAHALCLA